MCVRTANRPVVSGGGCGAVLQLIRDPTPARTRPKIDTKFDNGGSKGLRPVSKLLGGHAQRVRNRRAARTANRQITIQIIDNNLPLSNRRFCDYPVEPNPPRFFPTGSPSSHSGAAYGMKMPCAMRSPRLRCTGAAVKL